MRLRIEFSAGSIGAASRCSIVGTIAVAVLSLIACDDWKRFDDDAKRICAKTIEDQLPGGQPFPEELPTSEELSRLVRFCSEGIVARVEPCRKGYKYGTDSALQCVDRYAMPALQEAASAVIQLTSARQAPRFEAAAALTRLWAAAMVYYNSDHFMPSGLVVPKSFPRSSGEMTTECCAAGTRCPTAENLGRREPWASLNFVPEDNKFLQYQFTSEGTGKAARFLAVVTINPSCSGRRHFLARGGKIAESGDVVDDGGLYAGDTPPMPLAHPSEADRSLLALFQGNLGGARVKDKVTLYDDKGLFDYIDGAASIFIQHHFRKLAAADMTSARGSDIDCMVYDMAEPANALSIFDAEKSVTARLVADFPDAVSGPLSFVFRSGRYYVKLTAFDAKAGAALPGLAKALRGKMK